MNLDPKEVQAIEQARRTRDGLIVLVKERGEIRQISTMQKKEVDKSKVKR